MNSPKNVFRSYNVKCGNVQLPRGGFHIGPDVVLYPLKIHLYHIMSYIIALYRYAVLKLAPLLRSRRGVAHFLHGSNAKTSTILIFYFMTLIKTILPFIKEKNWQKSMFSILAIP